jgi:hypothetical protein
MADDTYDPFNLRKHPGYYAELVQERDPTHDVAASYAKNHQYDGGILGQLERNPHGLGDSPLPFDPSGAEVRSTSEGGSAFTERPKDHLQPVAELISPTLGAFGAGQMAGAAYKEAGEGDYQEAGMSLAPLLAGMVVPGAPKGARGPKVLSREIDARGFYSPSLEAVKGLGQETGTVQQFRSMLLKAGGKPKELDAVGFDRAFPDPNAKVSRADIEQYLRDNRVQLGETAYGSPKDALSAAEEAEFGALSDRYRRDPDSVSQAEYERLGDLENRANQRDPTKFESYSTPGGIPGSYREVVTTLDPKGKARFEDLRARRRELNDAEMQELEDLAGMHDKNSSLAYQSSHWPGITNPLLHYRQKDFLNSDSVVSGNRPEQGAALTPSQPSLPGATGRQYPIAPRGEWYGEANFENTGGVMRSMSPDEFLAQARPLKMDPESRENIDLLKQHIEEGKTLDPFQLYAGGKEDGRHRAYAAKELGIDQVPVIVFDPTKKNLGAPYPQSGSGEGTTSGGAFRSPESNLPSKTRVLDEMQSDWAQRARDAGTRDPAATAQLQALHQEAAAKVKAVADEMNRAMDAKASREVLDEINGRHREAANTEFDLRNKLKAAESGVPSAPFISNTSDWVDLGLKQALIDAAKDPSVNRLAWAPGKVQADRYNLAQHYSGLEYMPDTGALRGLRRDSGGHYYKIDNPDNPSTGGFTPEQLEGAVGKEIAQKLLATPARPLDGAPHVSTHRLELPEDFVMGGEGMKSFYGDMTPEGYQSGIVGTRLQKLVKGLDPEAAKIEPHGLNPDYGFPDSAYAPGVPPPVRPEMRGYKQTYPSIPITPAMREKILKEGLPLFNVAALSALVSRILGQGQPDTEGEDGGGF